MTIPPHEYTRHLYSSTDAVEQVEAWYQAALHRFKIPYQSCYLQTRHGLTHLINTGNPKGKPVILLHGLMNNAPIWQPQLEALQDFCVYAVDIIGQPGRSYPRRPSLLTRDYARWLVDVMNGLGLARATVVGLSFGAYLTLRLAAFVPERVEKALLLSPSGLAPLRLSALRRITMANMPWVNFKQAMHNLMERIYSTPGVQISIDTEHIREFLELTARYQKPIRHPRVLIESVLPGLPLLASEVARCTMPVKIISGEQDALFDPEQIIRRAKRVLPRFQGAQIIPKAGHAMIYEQVEQVNAAMIDFLSL